jgi:hypothetical protein
VNDVIGQVMTMAVAVLVSPIPIAAEIVLLFSARPKPNAAAYGGGFVLGVGLALGALTAVAATRDLSPGSDGATWAGWLKVVLGAALAVAGVHRFLTRPAPGGAAPPKWMAGIEDFTPGRSLVVGVGIGALNPKNLVVGLAAAVVIAAGDLSTGGEVATIVAYAVFASLGVLAPLVVAIAMGPRADDLLGEWRSWLVANNDVVMAVLLTVIGVAVAGKGVAAL